MVYDIELVEGAFGPDEGFTVQINDENGDGDDLTAYGVVRLVISDIQYTSPPTRVHVATDAEVEIDATGLLKYVPTNTNPVPVFGKYYIQIFREDGTDEDKPTQKFSLLITQGVPKT